ncbi:GGDEF domain-containing protein [Pseudomonas sp. StFLB209]|uniref:sensor domain-containing diguanylate cyclase n=1 Tax=Pseudomonas sp. StFLB209 TaxID=1028989 RepID=UPI0004F6E4AE|nr:sensor domain-containing diguanylate cyclase [Pseudomonas sp. StFLB209]BAP45418.1 GGDEF domain-containing protein [Pseudomonas sp. StFLB209]
MNPTAFLSGRLTPKALSMWIVVFICLVCVSLLLATLWQVKQSADERLANARSAVFNIVRAAEQHATDTVRQADSTLKNIAERIEVDGWGAPQRLRLSQLMARNVVDVEGVQGLFIYDEHGNWIANSFTQTQSSRNNSDRDYFIWHRDNPSAAVHIGSIVASRTTGDLIVPISRRLNHDDGSFAGVVLATVPVAYFQSFFERLDVDGKGVIFLALANGDLLARRPTLEKIISTNIAKGEIFSRYLPLADHGSAVVTSVVDGVERLYAYQRIPGLPLVTAAGLSLDAVYAQWWNYVWRSFALTGLMVTVVALLGYLIWQQIQRLLRAEHSLSAAHRELEQIARTDGLTSIANRRSFDLALEREWAHARINRLPLGVILLDIDWFKQYNDRYGHLQGDECLKRVARLLRDNLERPDHMAARYGGEEFVILLPGSALADAAAVAERVRAAIAADCLEHAASPLGHVSISAGVVSSDSLQASNAAQLLASADQLLYQAKQQGRNRVCQAGPRVYRVS